MKEQSESHKKHQPLIRWKGGCRCGGERRTVRQRCPSISLDEPIKRPDLAIYSQREELENGWVPTWDSPDIWTNDWKPFRLKNKATVKVRNLSFSAPAINTMVHYSTAPFGIGFPKVLRLTKFTNITPGSEVTLEFPIEEEIQNEDPRIAVYIDIDHPFDTNRINNSGAQIHDGAMTSESGKDFTVSIPVFNNMAIAREMHFYILPTNLVAEITPSNHTFSPFEQFNIQLQVNVPNTLTGTAAEPNLQSVTVVGRLTSSNEIVGGVTRLVQIDN